MFDLSDSVAIVSGASSGLGAQMAKGLAAQGANMVVLARREEKLAVVAAEIRETYGVDALAIPTDITDLSAVKAAVKKVKEHYGKADILINCAGTGGVIPALEMSDDEWNKDIALDLSATFRVCREFMRELIQYSEHGRIINIASMYGLVGNTALPSSAYHAAKGGAINLTRALAAEWAKTNTTVNCICPGYFATELTIDTLRTESFQEYMNIHVPKARYGREGELNSAAVFLAAKESDYVTGVVLPVDGGYTCV